MYKTRRTVAWWPASAVWALCALPLACATPVPPELVMSYEQAAARAESDDQRKPDYKPEAKSRVRPRLFRGALDCGLFGQGVGLVLAIAADGTVAATYVKPDDRKTRCLARRARVAELPPPPFAPFFVGASTLEED